MDVLQAARANIGIPYRFGGSSPQTGFDCSGLVCWSYGQVGIQLPRNARDQFSFGEKVAKDQLQPGDIVVFKGTNNRTGWHSGIYSGNGMFVHSPSAGKTVTETSLDHKYYASRFIGARRVPRDGSAETMMAAYMERQKELSASQKSLAKSTGKKKNSRLMAAKGKKKPLAAAFVAQRGKNKKTSRSSSKTVVSRKSTADVSRKLPLSKPLQTAAAIRGKNVGKQADATVRKLKSQRQTSASLRNARASVANNSNSKSKLW